MNFYEIINELIETPSWSKASDTLFLIDNLPTDLIRYLHIHNVLLHARIARYQYTPIDILINLSKHPDDYVRANVAINTNTPIEILKELSFDKTPDIRWHVTNNSNTPLETLIELSKDKDFTIRDRATENRINRIGLLK